jgi:alcohol dehydrogenase class IV
MLPRLAVVDPALTLDLPRAITVSTGLDALTQLIEPYLSIRANPIADQFCVEGMRRAALALPRVCSHPSDLAARSDMALASLLGGLALANAALGAVHGFAAPIGGMFNAPHGAVCAALLPHVMAVNLHALKQRRPEVLVRFTEVARLLTGSPHAGPSDAVDWIAALCRRLEVPPLAAYGITSAGLPELVRKAAQASSMKGNPIALTEDELREIVTRALS